MDNTRAALREETELRQAAFRQRVARATKFWLENKDLSPQSVARRFGIGDRTLKESIAHESA